MLSWLWQNKHWIFDGVGVAVGTGLLLLARPMATAIRRWVVRWRAVVAMRRVSTLRNAAWAAAFAGAAIWLGLMVIPTWSEEQPVLSETNSVSVVEPLAEPYASTIHLAGDAGRPAALAWFEVTREGVEICQGHTNSKGELACALLPGLYDVSGEVSGVPQRFQVDVAQETPVLQIRLPTR